jgi:hypothetical protein
VTVLQTHAHTIWRAWNGGIDPARDLDDNIPFPADEVVRLVLDSWWRVTFRSRQLQSVALINLVEDIPKVGGRPKGGHGDSFSGCCRIFENADAKGAQRASPAHYEHNLETQKKIVGLEFDLTVNQKTISHDKRLCLQR